MPPGLPKIIQAFTNVIATMTNPFTPKGENQCQLDYEVTIDSGELTDPFNQNNISKILKELKTVIERT